MKSRLIFIFNYLQSICSVYKMAKNVIKFNFTWNSFLAMKLHLANAKIQFKLKVVLRLHAGIIELQMPDLTYNSNSKWNKWK